MLQANDASSSWTIDPDHSKIGFKVKHLGISNVRGEFAEFEAAVTLDVADLHSLDVSATFQTGSLTTGNERRDGHLKSPDFFAAEEFPTMTFESTEVRDVHGAEFALVGLLTIRDVTREIVLDAEFLGSAAMGEEERAGFEARGTVDRMDYGLAWNMLTEAGGFVVGRRVNIILELELIKDAS